jgi:hypothetical protein
MEGEEVSVDFTGQLRRLSPRMYPFSSISGIVVRSAGGGSDTLNPPVVVVTTGTVSGGLKNFRALMLEDHVTDVPLGDEWWKWIYHVRGKLGAGLGAAQGPCGVGIGHPYDNVIVGSVRPPWPDPSETTWCRLYYDRNSNAWVLQSTPGNGVTPTTTVTWANPFTEVFFPQFFELVYDPFVRAVYAIIGGVERMRISDPTGAILPHFDSSGVIAINYLPLANFFVESNAVNGATSYCFFSNFICWNEDMDLEGATMWA